MITEHRHHETVKDSKSKPRHITPVNTTEAVVKVTGYNCRFCLPLINRIHTLGFEDTASEQLVRIKQPPSAV